ncbi:MAG: tRNA pseudouridine(38-40) synthase TruA [Clostridia bacterium]|nr:tRNA pseudouridine(38-40) synthase TruA [Clostridia bacterium]
MTNFRLVIQYDGKRYSGWQKQGNTGNTIQGKIEQILSRMTGYAVEIHGAGRTDAGVHARAQIANAKIATEQTAEEVMDYLNAYLPADIAITACEPAPERFHARLNAKGKHYCYRLCDGSVPDVFRRNYICAWERALDIADMQKAAACLVGTHDFRAFSSVNRRFKKSTVRTITALDVIRDGQEIWFDIQGTGFLYNMVRIIVGTLVEVGEGKRRPEGIPEILDSFDRQQAGITMPPHGLMLEEVFY